MTLFRIWPYSEQTLTRSEYSAIQYNASQSAIMLYKMSILWLCNLHWSYSVFLYTYAYTYREIILAVSVRLICLLIGNWLCHPSIRPADL